MAHNPTLPIDHNTPKHKVNGLMCVDIENGKYTIKQDEHGRLYALRYGEEWRDLNLSSFDFFLSSSPSYLASALLSLKESLIDYPALKPWLVRSVEEDITDFLKNSLL